MTEFKKNDRVIVNHGTIAEIISYDPELNLLSYKVELPGGSYERRTEHISSTHLQLMEPLPGRHERHDAPDIKQPKLAGPPKDAEPSE